LGSPLNLLAGLRPCFTPAQVPWHAPAGLPIKTEIVLAPSDPVVWDDPVLSLHQGVADLLSGIFEYAISPMVALDGPMTVGAGPLMTGPGADLGPFAHDLGIALKAQSYLLVRIKGHRGTRYFQPELIGLNRKQRITEWLTPRGRKAMARLRLHDTWSEGPVVRGDITARQALRYLGYFEQLGTHILGSLGFGDLLYQVFEVADDQADALRRIFDQEAGGGPMSGGAAFGLTPFTQPPWVTQASAIMSASSAHVARAVCADPIWHAGGGAAPSLLNGAARDALSRGAVLDRLPAQTVIAASFANQALYMEDFRADAWARMLRGALSHRFAGLTHTGWQSRGAFAPVRFLQSVEFSDAASLGSSPNAAVRGIGFALDLGADLPPRDAQGDYLALCASADPAGGGTLRRRPGWPDFDPRRFKVPFVDGAFEIWAEDGSRATLIEGLWLGGADAGDLHVAADPADVPHAQLLRHKEALADYVRLLHQLCGPVFAPEVHTFAIRCAMWLAQSAQGDAALDQLGWDATWVARGDPWVLDDPGPESDTLSTTVRNAVSLMALAPDMDALEPGAKALAEEVAAIYRAAAGSSRDALAGACAQSAKAVADGCAVCAAVTGLSDVTRAAFTAGAGLLAPPDHRVLPHAPLTGAHPVPRLWNGVMTLRTHVAKIQAILAACAGDPAAAVAALRREPMSPRLATRDPGADILEAVTQLEGDGGDGADALRSHSAELGNLARRATLIHRTDLTDPALVQAKGEPQVLRLIAVLDLLNLCRLSGLPVAPLPDLAPSTIVARLEGLLASLQG
jgi:hypothetical protein